MKSNKNNTVVKTNNVTKVKRHPCRLEEVLKQTNSNNPIIKG